MSCGPTPDWDHDFGCDPDQVWMMKRHEPGDKSSSSAYSATCHSLPRPLLLRYFGSPQGFGGGFRGLAFVSCAGPFRGMECSFDDGTRFVAALSATPLLQYYDATQVWMMGLRFVWMQPTIEGLEHSLPCHAHDDAGCNTAYGYVRRTTFLMLPGRGVPEAPAVTLSRGGGRILPQLLELESIPWAVRAAVHVLSGDLLIWSRPPTSRGRTECVQGIDLLTASESQRSFSRQCCVLSRVIAPFI